MVLVKGRCDSCGALERHSRW